MSKPKKIIVVTGGAGFIGSHLCERLVKDGHTVVSLDNYFTGSTDNHVKGVEYRKGHTKDIEKHVPETPDIVYHLGEYSRTAVAIEEPNVVFDLNTLGTFGVLEHWRKRKYKLVYAGSSTKFADVRADHIEGRHLSPYTYAKAVNTDLVRDYGRWYQLPWAIAYFYNVYGPRELSGKYGTVVEIFKQQYLAGQPLTMRLPGTQKRTYTHVLDTVNGLIHIGEQGNNDEFGIAAHETYTTRAVAEMFDTEIEELPARKTSRPSTPVDTSKLETLGWQQQHYLTDYIKSITRSR
ncbi:MAG: hypothetical protein B7X04_00510 [Parcubacteria group bacterium 21-54-25]|nr:MAG: hypothetical protein B7X04_00510 [Parcubacteria group bacterium 21-54-25]HQU07464.1 NAD-dependent epimerase/dehydratase family protein [Candidatus Paceibacterota bacterium]